MANLSAADKLRHRYGPLTFAAAVVNILSTNLYIWLLAPFSILGYPLFLLPVVAVDLAVAAALATRPGRLGQVGRGMLIGLLSVPIGLAVFISGFAIAHSVGPI